MVKLTQTQVQSLYDEGKKCIRCGGAFEKGISDNELLRQIQESREDYRRGRFKKLSELIEE
jgi:PHP family Zn ribbon phosphoesterase